MAASGDQGEFDSFGVGSAQRFQVGSGDLELGIEEGPVNINGNEANGHEDIVNRAIEPLGDRTIGP